MNEQNSIGQRFGSVQQTAVQSPTGFNQPYRSNTGEPFARGTIQSPLEPLPFGTGLNPAEPRGPGSPYGAQGQNGAVPVSPIAQSMFGPLVTGGLAGQHGNVNSSPAPAQAGTQAPRGGPLGQHQQPNSPYPQHPLGPYLQFLGALPQSMKPNMQGPLMQMYANLLSGGIHGA